MKFPDDDRILTWIDDLTLERMAADDNWRQAILKAYDLGIPVSVIAYHAAVSPQRVYQLLKKRDQDQ